MMLNYITNNRVLKIEHVNSSFWLTLFIETRIHISLFAVFISRYTINMNKKKDKESLTRPLNIRSYTSVQSLFRLGDYMMFWLYFDYFYY